MTAEAITDQPYEVQVEYAKKHLGTIGKGLLHLARERSFRSLLYTEVEKQRWGETSVLFSTLYEEAKTQNIPLSTAMAEEVGHAALREAFSAFVGIEGKVLYPHLYIPFYEERLSRNVAARITGEKPVADPVLVINAGKEEESYKGYTLNASGRIVELPLLVDEDYARKNEVWVVALSETAMRDFGMVTMKICPQDDPYATGCDPPPPPPDDPTAPIPTPVSGPPRTCTPDGNTGNPRLGEAGIDVWIDQMMVACHKESWASGSSEIRLRVSTLWNTGFDPFTAQRPSRKEFWSITSEFIADIGEIPRINYGWEYVIMKLRRSWIADKRVFFSNYLFAERWGGMIRYPVSPYTRRRDERRDVITYVMFEFDGWPTPEGNKSVAIYTDGGTNPTGVYSKEYITLYYRSNDSYYAVNTVNWYQGSPNYACGEKVDNSCIKFNFITRNPTF